MADLEVDSNLEHHHHDHLLNGYDNQTVIIFLFLYAISSYIISRLIIFFFFSSSSSTTQNLDESATSSKEPPPASNAQPSGIDWTQVNSDDASEEQSSGEGDDKESKKAAKKLRYKSAPFLDLENHEALRAFILDHHDPWKAAIDLMALVNTQKYNSDQVGVVTEVVTPCLRERIPDPAIVTPEQQFAALEAYVSCRISCFEYYDELFLFNQIEDKDLLGEFLLEQIKNVSQCNAAEKVLKIFLSCKVENVSLILTSLLITFFKVRSSPGRSYPNKRD